MYEALATDLMQRSGYHPGDEAAAHVLEIAYGRSTDPVERARIAVPLAEQLRRLEDYGDENQTSQLRELLEENWRASAALGQEHALVTKQLARAWADLLGDGDEAQAEVVLRAALAIVAPDSSCDAIDIALAADLSAVLLPDRCGEAVALLEPLPLVEPVSGALERVADVLMERGDFDTAAMAYDKACRSATQPTLIPGREAEGHIERLYATSLALESACRRREANEVSARAKVACDTVLSSLIPFLTPATAPLDESIKSGFSLLPEDRFVWAAGPTAKLRRKTRSTHRASVPKSSLDLVACSPVAADDTLG